MSRNWQLHENLSSIQKERDLLALKVDSMELENAYYSSDEYKELAARKYLDKKLPGEYMIKLEPNSEKAKNKYATTDSEKPAEQQLSNLEKWARFIFSR